MFGRDDAGARGHVAEERDVADAAALDGRTRRRLEGDLHRARFGGVAPEIALVLQCREVRVHRGWRRQADRLSDLADARWVAPLLHLRVDELQHLALALGQAIGGGTGGVGTGGPGAGGCGHAGDPNTITRSGQTPVRFLLDIRTPVRRG